jgi:alkylated DNA repair dioxygenase AlkB
MQRVFECGNAFLDKGVFQNTDLIEQCVADVASRLEARPVLVMYGKVCHQQRDVGFFSDNSKGYHYARQIMTSQPLTLALMELIDVINATLGTTFNGMLVNKYQDGNDYIGAHSDSLIGLDTAGVVALSYGAERKFRIRCKQDKQIVHEEKTTHCSVLQMGGNFQELFTHEIPVEKRVKDARYSFTFRSHVV